MERYSLRLLMLRFLRVFAILLATAVACVAIIYFSIPMADTQQDHFDVILVLGNPARADGSIGQRVEQRTRLRRADALQNFDGSECLPFRGRQGGTAQHAFLKTFQPLPAFEAGLGGQGLRQRILDAIAKSVQLAESLLPDRQVLAVQFVE